MPKFAANLTMMFNEVPFLERFAAARNAGFAGVEMLFPYEFEASELAARLNDNGLTQALFNLPPGSWEAGERGLAALPGREDEFRAGVDLAVAYADAMECKTLHVMAGVVPAGVPWEQMFETFVDNLAYAADVFAKTGLTAVLEPLNSRDAPGYFLPHAADAARVIKAVDRANVGLQFDFYHVQIMDGDLARNFKAHRDITRHIQVSGVPERHEPDIGEINYPYLFDLIDDSGYDGWVGCEYRPRADTTEGLGWLRALSADGPEGRTS